MKTGWHTSKLASLCEVFADGDWIESKDQSQDGFRLIQTGNVGLGEFKDRAEKARYISEDTFKRLRCTEIHEGDCLVSRLPDPAGRACIIPNTGEPMITAVDCTIIRFHSEKVLPIFFNYYAQSYAYLNAVASQSTGATRLRISRAKLGEIPVPIPSLAEQKRIVTILDEAFAGIATATANAEKNLANARELFERYLQSILTNKGKGWETKKLGEVAEYFNGLTYSPKDVCDKGIIVLRSSNVQNDELDFRDIVRVNLTVKDKILVQDGDILMCSRNGSKRLVGKTATIKNLGEVMTFGTFMMIVRSQNNPYLAWFFKSLDFRKQISGGENTMINQITRYMLDDVSLAFPPAEKQSEIVQKLDELSTETKKLEAIYQKKLIALNELKKSILNQAFSGQLQ